MTLINNIKIGVIIGVSSLFAINLGGCRTNKSSEADNPTKAEFEQCYKEFQLHKKRPEVQIAIGATARINCDGFKKIVFGGKKYIPFIVEKIKEGDFYLNYAMKEITEIDIREHYKITTDKKNIGEQATSALWLRWWDENKMKYSH